MKPSRLVVVGPGPGRGGVGDYCETLFGALAPHFETHIFLETGGAGEDTWSSIRRVRAELRALLKDEVPTVLHFELSGGSLAPFWSLDMAGRALQSATVHDAPFPVWWPLRSTFLARRRFWNHGVHYPLRRVWQRVETRRLSHVGCVALTRSGVDALSAQGLKATHIPHFVPNRPTLPPPSTRPLNIGLFGMNYGGKGFERLAKIREQLPASVGIVVAGRGTERLPQIDGVRVLGPVEGAEEDAFFSGVRAILVPYTEVSRYGRIFSASGVVARAHAYGTPVVASAVRAFPSEADGLALSVAPAEELVSSAHRIVTSESFLVRSAAAVEELRTSRAPERIAERFVELWSK